MCRINVDLARELFPIATQIYTDYTSTAICYNIARSEHVGYMKSLPGGDHSWPPCEPAATRAITTSFPGGVWCLHCAANETEAET